MGILRSYFMVGFLIGGDINTMSIYSMSLKLLIKSRFFHPGYHMDDIIYTLSAMKATKTRICVRTIDLPTLSGPTSGVNLKDEFREWTTQATRWTIGAVEVFHYFFVKLIRGNYFLPGITYFWWFVYYYGFVLCVSGLIGITDLITRLVGLVFEEYSMESCRPCQSWFGLEDDSPFYTWIIPSFTLFNYFTVFSTAFLMDAVVSQILALDENVSLIRNVLHWLSSQFVLWAYCVVEYRAIFLMAFYGKDVCSHTATEKHALVGANAMEDKSSSDEESEANINESPEKALRKSQVIDDPVYENGAEERGGGDDSCMPDDLGYISENFVSERCAV